MNTPDSPSGIETQDEDVVVEKAQRRIHAKIGDILTGTVEIGADAAIGTAKVLAYGTGRAVRGVFDIGRAIKGGLENKSYHQSA
ncbi:hypothetical protein K8942_05000 [Candidatus Peribacteria bacterium]|nr:MAG: hypothetical protein K8942_05000 [Candidatus Peribacteria bacterium]